MAIVNSCYGCRERHQGCHATCKKYKDYKLMLAAEKKKIEEYKSPHNTMSDAHIKARWRKSKEAQGSNLGGYKTNGKRRPL